LQKETEKNPAWRNLFSTLFRSTSTMMVLTMETTTPTMMTIMERGTASMVLDITMVTIMNILPQLLIGRRLQHP